MRVVIFSGTTEGRELSRRLADAGASVLVCVATDYGREEQGEYPGVRVRTGPMTSEEKKELLGEADLCVDATHPYATHISGTVKTVCRQIGVRYLRVLRAPGGEERASGHEDVGAAHHPRTEIPRGDAADGTEKEQTQGNAQPVEEWRGGDRQTPASAAAAAPEVRYVNSAGEAAEYLADHPGNILLTTGAKELSAYAGLNPNRIFPRILPTVSGLEACETLGVPRRNIIAMQGPFSREMNIATIRQYGIDWLVTKDGGEPGGFFEKASAARAVGISMIVLRRPAEEGLDFDTVWSLCEEAMAEEMREGLPFRQGCESQQFDEIRAFR